MCQAMDSILHPDVANDPSKDPSEAHSHSRRRGLSFAVGGVASANKQISALINAAIPATRPLTRAELSNKFRDHFGYTLDIRPSGIPQKDAGQGLFLTSYLEKQMLVLSWPSVLVLYIHLLIIDIYLDTQELMHATNYLITRYNGIIIGSGSGLWDGSGLVGYNAVPPKGSENC